MFTSLLLYSHFGLLIVRVVFGIIFLAHGLPKLKTQAQFAGFLQSLKVPLPKLAALLIALVEVVGAIFVIVGFWTQLAGLLLAINMFFAIMLVVRKKGFVGGYEFELLLLAVGLMLALMGAGSISVDARLVR